MVPGGAFAEPVELSYRFGKHTRRKAMLTACGRGACLVSRGMGRASRLLRGCSGGGTTSRGKDRHVAQAFVHAAAEFLTLVQRGHPPATAFEGDLPLVRTSSLGVRCCLSFQWLGKSLRSHRLWGRGRRGVLCGSGGCGLTESHWAGVFLLRHCDLCPLGVGAVT